MSWKNAPASPRHVYSEAARVYKFRDICSEAGEKILYKIYSKYSYCHIIKKK